MWVFRKEGVYYTPSRKGEVCCTPPCRGEVCCTPPCRGEVCCTHGRKEGVWLCSHCPGSLPFHIRGNIYPSHTRLSCRLGRMGLPGNLHSRTFLQGVGGALNASNINFPSTRQVAEQIIKNKCLIGLFIGSIRLEVKRTDVRPGRAKAVVPAGRVGCWRAGIQCSVRFSNIANALKNSLKVKLYSPSKMNS